MAPLTSDELDRVLAEDNKEDMLKTALVLSHTDNELEALYNELEAEKEKR